MSWTHATTEWPRIFASVDPGCVGPAIGPVGSVWWELDSQQ
jgi:hypothetical protein